MRRISPRGLGNSLLVAVLFLVTACSFFGGQQTNHEHPVSQFKYAALPGQQVWKDGASSFLFGTNDTFEWSQKNIQNQPEIQNAIRQAGFTLIRSFFPDNAKDNEIEQRMLTIEKSGAQCLGVITNIKNTTFNKHLISYLGKRCQMYEFGNEPDYNGYTSDAYLKLWNTEVPELRQVNPNAKFIGPVTYNDQGNNGFMKAFLEGVKNSKVLPDAISYHWYPCYKNAKEDCLAKAKDYGKVAQGVETLVHNTLGKDLPVGISEWNYDPGNPPPAYGDDPQFIKQFSTDALHSMAQAGVAFACQFDAASYSGYGRLDMFNVENNQPKAQYYAIKDIIQQYRTASASDSTTPPTTPNATVNATTNTVTKLISRGKDVTCTGNDAGANGSKAIVDGHYGNWSFWRTSTNLLPAWCAIHLDAGPSRILLSWTSDYVFDYINKEGMEPLEYNISTSADSTNGSDGTWKTAVTVTDNHARVREHLIPFAGQSWVKMTVTKPNPTPSQNFVTIDQIDVYDVSAGLEDTFFFSGDSITAMAYSRLDEAQPSFAEDVHKAHPERFPVMFNGGLGGWTSDGAVENIDSWLALNPDMHYWLMGWGTNDASADVTPEHFQANLQTLITKIRNAGHIPIIARIPYRVNGGDVIDQKIQALNTVIDQLTKTNGLIPGPDLYALVKPNADKYLLKDGIHPTPVAEVAMNKAWFEALNPYLYAN